VDYLPKRSPNLRNLSHITSINLRFSLGTQIGATERTKWKSPCSRPLGTPGGYDSHTMDRRILHSLDPPILSTTQRLTISEYGHPDPAEAEECPVFETLSSMDNLRTLILIKCNNLPFILALNPRKNLSKLVLCPGLEELVLYTNPWNQLPIQHLIDMAEDRASRGAKLSSITIVSLGGLREPMR
jgi:hypothetical protein